VAAIAIGTTIGAVIGGRVLNRFSDRSLGFRALYFAWRKDTRYVLITAFVLIALTISLALH